MSSDVTPLTLDVHPVSSPRVSQGPSSWSPLLPGPHLTRAGGREGFPYLRDGPVVSPTHLCTLNGRYRYGGFGDPVHPCPASTVVSSYLWVREEGTKEVTLTELYFVCVSLRECPYVS